MRVVLTGATGVIAQHALPILLAAGHDVVGVHRRAEDADRLRSAGATPVVADLFDTDAVAQLVCGADAVVHLATSIPPIRHMTKASKWADNDRLRDIATDRLVSASARADVEVFVQASITFNYVDGGVNWIDEDDAVDPPFVATVSALAAERHVAQLDGTPTKGVVLRLAQLYGPGDVSAELVDELRRRRVPLIGRGTNFVSNLHVSDAGSAVAAALDIPPGIYNVADNEPLTARERINLQTQAVGAPPPRQIPAVIARVVAGRASSLLTVSQRISNRKFRRAANWQPSYPSVLQGWTTTFGTTATGTCPTPNR